MPDEQTLWRIHTKSNGSLTAKAATNGPADLNRPTRGETAAWTFRLASEALVVPSGETYTVESGTEEVYSSADIDGTLNVDGTLTLTEGQFDTLRQLADHAGSFATVQTLNNTQNYREQIPSDASVDSIVVGIEPAQALKDRNVDGVWGIVSNGTDARSAALSRNLFQLEVQVLAEYSEYADHSAIETALQV
jgi:hypothetical protein